MIGEMQPSIMRYLNGDNSPRPYQPENYFRIIANSPRPLTRVRDGWLEELMPRFPTQWAQICEEVRIQGGPRFDIGASELPRIEVIIRFRLYYRETITIQKLFRYAIARRRVRRATLRQDPIQRRILQVLGRRLPPPLQVTGPAVIKIQQAIRGFIARRRYLAARRRYWEARWWRWYKRRQQKRQRKSEAAKTIQHFIRTRLRTFYITQILEERIEQGEAARLQLQRFREGQLRRSLLRKLQKENHRILPGRRYHRIWSHHHCIITSGASPDLGNQQKS